MARWGSSPFVASPHGRDVPPPQVLVSTFHKLISRLELRVSHEPQPLFSMRDLPKPRRDSLWGPDSLTHAYLYLHSHLYLSNCIYLPALHHKLALPFLAPGIHDSLTQKFKVIPAYLWCRGWQDNRSLTTHDLQEMLLWCCCSVSHVSCHVSFDMSRTLSVYYCYVLFC